MNNVCVCQWSEENEYNGKESSLLSRNKGEVCFLTPACKYRCIINKRKEKEKMRSTEQVLRTKEKEKMCSTDTWGQMVWEVHCIICVTQRSVYKTYGPKMGSKNMVQVTRNKRHAKKKRIDRDCKMTAKWFCSESVIVFEEHQSHHTLHYFWSLIGGGFDFLWHR